MDAQITIIGAGVVGLAIAARMSKDFGDVYVTEKHPTFGQETSSRNSEVIHAGIYYPQGSLKSKLCLEGKWLMYDYCREHDIPFKNCGKIIVATTDDEVRIIEGIMKTALGNGVDDLEMIEKDRIAELEPSVFAIKAIYSPSTGIVDSHSLMKSLETDIVINGGQIAYGSEVTGIRRIEEGYEITIRDTENTTFSFTTRIVINSAGLGSDLVSALAGLSDDRLRIRFCKGEYFRLNPPKNRLINRLVYPVPVHNLEGIGIHVTVDMDGGVKLGPDVTYLDSNVFDYKVNPSKQDAFYRSARLFLPFLEYDDLAPEMAGIRPKIQGPGEPVRDFYIKEESDRGMPDFINLIGMESPGLTSCLSIANHVRNLINM